jgi:hypothetical protein
VSTFELFGSVMVLENTINRLFTSKAHLTRLV